MVPINQFRSTFISIHLVSIFLPGLARFYMHIILCCFHVFAELIEIRLNAPVQTLESAEQLTIETGDRQEHSFIAHARYYCP